MQGAERDIFARKAIDAFLDENDVGEEEVYVNEVVLVAVKKVMMEGDLSGLQRAVGSRQSC